MNTEFNPVPMPDESREYPAGNIRRESSNEAQAGIRRLPCRDVGSRSRTIAAGFIFGAWRNVKTQGRPSSARKWRLETDAKQSCGNVVSHAGSNPAALILYPLVIAAMLVAAPNLSGASAGNTLSAQAQRLVESSFGGSKIGAMHKVTVLNSRCVADSNTSEQSSPSKAQLPLAQVVEIVAAIYRLEGGDKTKYPYGIRSIDTHGDKALAKRICENTVRNNYKRWIKAGGKGDYLDYLANVYCPPSADKQGNINWKRNIHKMVKWTL